MLYATKMSIEEKTWILYETAMKFGCIAMAGNMKTNVNAFNKRDLFELVESIHKQLILNGGLTWVKETVE